MCKPCPHDASTYQLVVTAPGRHGAAHTAAVPVTRRCGAGRRAKQGSAAGARIADERGGCSSCDRGNCGVVRRSEPRNPRADCALGHGVATALRCHFFSRFAVRPLAAIAPWLSEQVQGILDSVRAVYGGTDARLCRSWLFCAIFYCRNSEASGRLTRDPLRHVPDPSHLVQPRNAPPQAPRRRNDARGRRRRNHTPPPRAAPTRQGL